MATDDEINSLVAAIKANDPAKVVEVAEKSTQRFF
jgi:hypothetical protein